MTEQKLCAKRHVVALAGAAALLAASGAAAADPVNYDRITTSIDQPDQDAAVTYTDDTGETIVGLTPVIPGDGVDPSSGITLTLKSLTVSNTTTAGETGETGRNGDAISTGTTAGTSAWQDPTTGGVHLAVSGDVSITARTRAFVASDNNNIDGTIGGDLTVVSDGIGLQASSGSHYATIDRGILLTLSGGEASITAADYGIETESSNVTVRIGGLQRPRFLPETSPFIPRPAVKWIFLVPVRPVRAGVLLLKAREQILRTR